MTIESRASLIVVLRSINNFVSFITAFGIVVWLIVAITDTNDPEFFFILVPLYALFSTFFDWISSKLNANWLRETDPELKLEKQGVTVAEFKSYLNLVLKFRLIRIGIGGVLAAITFMFSFYPLFIFAFIYLVSFIASLCYFYVMDVKIPKDLQFEPSTGSPFSKERIENNPAIIGTAANSMRRHS